VRRLIEIVTQAGDCPGIIGRPAVGEAARGGTSPRQGSGIHDGVQVGPDGWLVGIPDLGEDIADLVRPAALSWASLTEAQRQQVTESFARYMRTASTAIPDRNCR
jgi:hypothetical protein